MLHSKKDQGQGKTFIHKTNLRTKVYRDDVAKILDKEQIKKMSRLFYLKKELDSDKYFYLQSEVDSILAHKKRKQRGGSDAKRGKTTKRGRGK